jgi:phosphoribosylformylglycinamidine (FGAM) synthase
LGLIIVEVMPKPEILDPQGKAVRGAFLRHGVDVFTDVRQGKRFQLSVEGPVTEAHLESVRELAATSLSNPIIEDVVAVYAAEGER